MRLQKYLAQCGIGSRRKCEEIIKSGRVSVNDSVADEMGIKINPDKDIVKIDGKEVTPEKNMVYILLNKPVGIISSVKDQFNRSTVLDCISHKYNNRVYPIGRLDYDTEGLIVLTNDGRLTNLMTHPRHEVEKEYEAWVKGIPDAQDLLQLESGIDIGGYVTSPAKARIIKSGNNGALVRLIVREGKNRQVRRMFEAINHRVVKLRRVRIGSIRLGTLRPGEWRFLTPAEVSTLYKDAEKGKKEG